VGKNFFKNIVFADKNETLLFDTNRVLVPLEKMLEPIEKIEIAAKTFTKT